MTEREIAETYGLGVRFLRNYRMRGGGPVWRKVSGQVGKAGGRVLYDVESVEKWILAQAGGGERIEAEAR
jgi:hypothetical protein